MKFDEQTLQRMALIYPIDVAALETAQLARELLAARLVVEAARVGNPERLQDALVAYDEAVR